MKKISVLCFAFIVALSIVGCGKETAIGSAEFEITGEYASEKQDYISAIQSWNLDTQMKVSELSDIVQNYLNENYDGLQIKSEAFQKFVLEMFGGDSYPLAQMAEENSEFGALYLYMCIYYDENISDDLGYFTNAAEQPLSAETMKMTLGEVFDADFKQNHQESLQSIEPTIAEQGDSTGFFLNFAGNHSLQHDIVLTDDTPYWTITVNNEGNEDIVVEINEVVYRIPGGKAEVISTEEKWEPGTYSVNFSGSGATSQMIGNATCVLSTIRVN